MKKAADIYIPRHLEKIVKKTAKDFPAVAVTGPRQSGKSTMLSNIFKDTHSFVSFDDPLTRENAFSDPKLLIDNLGENIIFDEIQYVPQILPYIKILIDENRQKRGRYILTGSHQFHLIKNLGDTLAGRTALLELMPFSVAEKKKIYNLGGEFKNTKQYFIHSCLRGSFPEINTHRNINAQNWYGSYIQTYLERDIRTIYNIGSLREFQRFLQLLASRTSQILNLTSFSNDLGISVNTIKKWISILEASRIIFALPPYYRNLGKRITKNPKIYFLDTGLVCYLTGIKTEEYILNGPLAGALFENFIIQETVKYFLNKGIMPRLYYIRTHNNIEIDLIIEKSLELYPFEIKLTKTPNPNMTKPMESFADNFSKLKINNGKIICLTDKDIPLTNKVTAIGFNSYIANLDKLEVAL